MGNVLEVSIAVCLEQVIVDTVLHFKICDSDDDDKTISKLALIALALRSCASTLQQGYRRLERRSPENETRGRDTWHLPCPSVDPSLGVSTPALVFKSRLNRNNEELATVAGDPLEMRSLFLADYTPPPPDPSFAVEVVVKFAVTYNVVAHKLLATSNFAPKLYTSVPVIGKREMVVMERVNGKPMCKFKRNSLPPTVFEDVKKALKILHGAGLVFGDLRDTNVMVLAKDSEGRIGAKLIDFDWVGVAGSAAYPNQVNAVFIGREFSPDVRGLGLISLAHDWHAFNYLENRYQGQS